MPNIAPQSSTTSARIIDVSLPQQIALAPINTLDLIENARILPVPGAKNYFQGIVSWQGNYLQVINIKALINQTEHDNDYNYVLVVVYKDQQQIRYGAIAINNIVNTLQVSDADGTEFSSNAAIWSQIADSCLNIHDKNIPIVNLSKLFNY